MSRAATVGTKPSWAGPVVLSVKMLTTPPVMRVPPL